MATYFDIFGQQVQYLSSDPSPSAEGQVWFNSTTSVAKVVGFNPGSWSTGGVYPVSYNGMSNGGSTPDGVVFGGGTGPVPSYTNQSATYNGTSWTGAPTVPFTHSLGGGTGPGAAAIGGGGDGNEPGLFAEWDDSSWTATPAMGKNAYQCKLVGTQAAAVAAGLYYDSTAQTWNGTTWADPGAAMPVHVYSSGAVGSATAGSWVGGYGPIPTANAQSTQQEFNGSAWSTGVAMPGTGVPMGQTANGAPNDDYWLVGMSGTYLTGSTTAQFDGSAWTTATNAPLTTSNAAGGGTDKSSGYLVGGYVPGPNTRTNATQEFSGGAQAQTITTS